jgi:hypothetical protein
MSIYRPAGQRVFVMDFQFKNQRIRESTGMTSKTRAKEVYEKRKQSLKDGTAGIRRQTRPDLLSTAAAEWQLTKRSKWSVKMLSIVEYSMGHLLPVLGKMLLVDIEASDIQAYQASRKAETASNRTINIEVGMLNRHISYFHQSGTVFTGARAHSAELSNPTTTTPTRLSRPSSTHG